MFYYPCLLLLLFLGYDPVGSYHIDDVLCENNHLRGKLVQEEHSVVILDILYTLT